MGAEMKRSRYSPEVRERSVRMVFEQREQHSSQWGAIESKSKGSEIKEVRLNVDQI
jgi:transposase